MTIGEAIAFLEAERNGGVKDHLEDLDTNSKEFLDKKREQLQSLEQDGRLEQLIAECPGNLCSSDTLCLDNNEAFFLAEFFCDRKSKHREDQCNRLFAKLNDCFECFEIYRAVVQDYVRKSQKLSENRK